MTITPESGQPQPQQQPQPQPPSQPTPDAQIAPQPIVDPQATQPTVQLAQTGAPLAQTGAPVANQTPAAAAPAQAPAQATYAPHPTQQAASSEAPYQQAAPVPGAAPYTSAPQSTSAPTTPKKSRAGVLFAGIAIGAVVGGIVGGGASALVLGNQGSSSIVQPQAGGTLTLNNLETATSVSGVAAAATPSVVTLEVSTSSGAGSGSGVIYSEDGYIVTNAHVVTLDGAGSADPNIRVWLSDGRILDGTLVGTDPFADLAVVKVDAEGLAAVKIADPDSINVGDLAVAIGAPLNLSNTVTSGVVSALNRGISVGTQIIPDTESEPEQQDESSEFPWFRFDEPNDQGSQQQTQGTATRVTLPVVQTDASINPGNSGGALLNANAELIGVNVAIASNGATQGTAGSDGLGFAIPINMVTRVADSLIAGERPSHGLLGIGVNDSSADTDQDRNYAGGLVSDVTRGGPADQGGLRVGDVITSVQGIPADSGTTVSALIRMHEGGEEVVIGFSRGGVQQETTITLGTLEW